MEKTEKTNQKTKDEKASKDEEPSNEPQDESTIAFKLKVLGIEDLTDLASSCHTLQDEFRAIKKAYFRKILVAHPDKGGDPEVFRSVNAARESLKVATPHAKLASHGRAPAAGGRAVPGGGDRHAAPPANAEGVAADADCKVRHCRVGSGWRHPDPDRRDPAHAQRQGTPLPPEAGAAACIAPMPFHRPLWGTLPANSMENWNDVITHAGL